MIESGSKFLGRTCSDCLAYMYDDSGKKMNLRGTDKPWPRPPKVLTPCHECPKVPDDAPEKTHHHAIEVSDKSWSIIRYHDECQATNGFPHDPATGEVDPLLRKNAALIESIRERFRRSEAKELIQLVALSMGLRQK